MAAIKANWHLEDLDLTDEDPEAGILQLQSGQAVSLRSSEAVAAEFRETVVLEAGFDAHQYMSCDLKWSVPVEGGGMRNPCRTCPMRCTDDRDPDSLLCDLGVRQEDLLDAFLAAKATEGLDEGMMDAFERELDSAHELAEALL